MNTNNLKVNTVTSHEVGEIMDQAARIVGKAVLVAILATLADMTPAAVEAAAPAGGTPQDAVIEETASHTPAQAAPEFSSYTVERTLKTVRRHGGSVEREWFMRALSNRLLKKDREALVAYMVDAGHLKKDVRTIHGKSVTFYVLADGGEAVA